MVDVDASAIALIAAFASDRIDLDKVLESLSRRSSMSDSEYSAGVKELHRLREEGKLDDETVATLIARMAVLLAESDDATVVRPEASPREAAGDPAAARPSQPLPSGDATQVRPAVVGAGASPPPEPGTTGGTGGTSASTGWESIANAVAGESADIGMLLKGRFLLERELGRGGMGVVFLARDERKVEARDRDPYLAVKVLNDDFRRHPDSLIALQRESRRSQQLAHDNIVRVYDFDKAETIVFMTMEYIDGQDLRTLIREQAWNGMPLARARPLIEGMARALGRAHVAGVVHSDFKPGNVMVTGDGVPKVFDFGIARAGKHAASADGEQTIFDATTLGALTPAYASLEMIQGGEPTASDDIYALGCVCFELLTGKHPFDKASVEVALKEGRKPPRVPGLTRRQYKALCEAVAFRREDRLKNVEDLLEGLRDVSVRERAIPLLGYGAAASMLAAGAVWGVSRYLDTRRIDGLVAGFSTDGPNRFATIAQASAALGSLDEGDRRDLLADWNELIEQFLLDRLDALWHPDRGRYEYVKAQQVFELRNELRLFSPRLDARREQMELERDETLNVLDTELGRQIAEGEIFAGPQLDAIDILDRVRAIDPDSALLRGPGLEQAYEQQIIAALAEGDLESAGIRLDAATDVFPESIRLLLARGRYDAAVLAEQSRQQVAGRTAGMDTDAARKLLAALVANPSDDPNWRNDVAVTVEALRDDSSESTQQLFDLLGRTIAYQVSETTEAVRLASGLSLVAFGLELVPESKELKVEQARLQSLHDEMIARMEREDAEAEVAALTESMRRAAVANDLEKARSAFQRLREKQPEGIFARKQAPQLLSGAYLRAAQAEFGRGEYSESAALTGAAVALLGDRLELRTANSRYRIIADIMSAEEGLGAEEHVKLSVRLEEVERSDAKGLATAEAQLRQHGSLVEGTLRARLQRLAPSTTKTTETSRPSTHRRKNEAGDPVAGAEGEEEEPLPPVPSGPDPCGKANLVGRGRFCFDALATGRGPTLVVVPGIGGGKPYALSRAEVTVKEFNSFCSATGKCRPEHIADEALGAAPIESIPIELARDYARWLIRSTGGWRYRLPTDAEWVHAAKANSDWTQASDSNCIPPTASAADAGGAPVSARGRGRNPWGLINLTGNVWEWVDGDGVSAVRGGAFTSFWSDCTVTATRLDNGKPQRDVGFRVLRELK